MKIPRGPIYYSDKDNDEFSGVKRDAYRIDENWDYLPGSILYKIFEFIIYRIIMTPVAYIYCKLKFGLRIFGREKLKKHKKGFYLYGNHTQIPGDGFFPTVIAFPRRVRVIVNSDNVALSGTRTFMKMVGALPVPSSVSAVEKFKEAVSKSAASGCTAVYPEGHIWPYYTGVRSFPPSAFSFPAKDGLSVFTFSVTYRKRSFKRAGVDIYIDGPFESTGESERKRRNELSAAAHDAVEKRVNETSNYSFVEYIDKNTGKTG